MYIVHGDNIGKYLQSIQDTIVAMGIGYGLDGRKLWIPGFQAGAC